MASVMSGTSRFTAARTVQGRVLPSPGTQTEEFIDRTLSGCNRFTGRSPRLSSVTPDGDRGPIHRPDRQGHTFRSRRRTPSRPGHPGRGHLDPDGAPALTPPRDPRIVGHRGAGIHLARPGDVGAIYPPSAVVACPSPPRSPGPAPTSTPRRSLTWPSRTHRRPRAGLPPQRRRGTTVLSSW